MDDIDNLEKLAKLRDRNILNEEEYVSLKQAIISRHVDYKGGAKSGVAYVVLDGCWGCSECTIIMQAIREKPQFSF